MYNKYNSVYRSKSVEIDDGKVIIKFGTILAGETKMKILIK